jgi:hypothetical protein
MVLYYPVQVGVAVVPLRLKVDSTPSSLPSIPNDDSVEVQWLFLFRIEPQKFLFVQLTWRVLLLKK